MAGAVRVAMAGKSGVEGAHRTGVPWGGACGREPLRDLRSDEGLHDGRVPAVAGEVKRGGADVVVRGDLGIHGEEVLYKREVARRGSEDQCRGAAVGSGLEWRAAGQQSLTLQRPAPSHHHTTPRVACQTLRKEREEREEACLGLVALEGGRVEEGREFIHKLWIPGRLLFLLE